MYNLVTVEQFAQENDIVRATLNTRINNARKNYEVDAQPVQESTGYSPALWNRDTLEEVNTLFTRTGRKRTRNVNKAKSRSKVDAVKDKRSSGKLILAKNKDLDEEDFKNLLDAMLDWMSK